MNNNEFIDKYTKITIEANTIEPEFYDQYAVKRGLRNDNGTGVLVGLTKVSNVDGYTFKDGVKTPIEGKLYYRGIDLKEIVDGFTNDSRRGFEEGMYLLLFGKLPTSSELIEFNELLGNNRELPKNFIENMILRTPSKDIMNKLQRSVLVLYSHEENPDDLSIENVLLQCIKLIALFPTIISYGYQAKAHYFDKKSLYIHAPKKSLGTAENILHMTRQDNKYTKTEAKILDLCLLLQADHGGGNNSAFVTHVVSSSGTDTYSVISSAIGCLKGPKHGGANAKVKAMINDIKQNCNYTNKQDLKIYLKRIINKEVYDKLGLIYGMGHAVYTLSDPRAVILKEKANELAIEKGKLKEYELYTNIEQLTKELFKELKGEDFVISANVDLYSGLVYEMLGIPEELFTPLFAVARIGGWCAHRIEQLISDKRIIRPSYQNVIKSGKYIPIEERK